MNSEPNPSLNGVTSAPESEGEAQRKWEHRGVKQTHLSEPGKKEEIKSGSANGDKEWPFRTRMIKKEVLGLHVRRLFV